MVMDNAAADELALFEAVIFLNHFKDLPDPRQRGKITYPLDEVLLLCLLAVVGGAETFVSRGSARRRSRCCAGSDRFVTGRPPTITSAIFLRRSMPRRFSAASFPGWRR